MPIYRIFEIVIHSLISFVPYIFLAIYPFKSELRFSKLITTFGMVFVTGLQLMLNFFALAYERDWIVALPHTFILVFLFLLFIKAHIGKILFTVIMLSNISNLVFCASKCLEGLIFPEFATQLYRWTSIITLIIAEAVILIPVFFFIKNIYKKAFHQPVATTVWRYIWAIPLTFFSVWFRNFYFSAEGAITLALRPRHLLYSLVINSGAILTYAMIATLINEQAENNILREKENTLLMQEKQVENLQKHIEETRHAKHDMRQHMRIISSYLDDKKYAELEAYINEYIEDAPGDKTIAYCDNYAVNALLQYFAGVSKQYDIEFSTHINVPVKIGIPDNILAVVCGNLLENAVEASAHEKNAKITVKGKVENGYLFFKIINTFTGETKKAADGSFLSTKHKGRGIGLRSVNHIVEEYNGIMKTAHEDSCFTASVMLEIPN